MNTSDIETPPLLDLLIRAVDDTDLFPFKMIDPAEIPRVKKETREILAALYNNVAIQLHYPRQITPPEEHYFHGADFFIARSFYLLSPYGSYFMSAYQKLAERHPQHSRFLYYLNGFHWGIESEAWARIEDSDFKEPYRSPGKYKIVPADD